MIRLLRLLKYATYPFLVLSMLLLAGMAMGSAFVTDFTIENRTEVPIVVTPVGTIGPEGRRAPLPIKLFAFPPLPALKNGGYRLAPGESITIQYDMDDINFSEIVVEAAPLRVLQLITDPKPTSHQYHGPLQRHYVIDDLSQLAPASAEVQAAAQAVGQQWVILCRIVALLIGPWLAYGVVAWYSSRWEQALPSETS